jgi:hypothetical protein
MFVSSTSATLLAPRPTAAIEPSPVASPSPATEQQGATGDLPVADSTGTSTWVATSLREDNTVSQRVIDLGRDHLALHLFTTRNRSTAQQLNVTDGAVVTELATSVAAAYSVDLTIEVSFLGDLTGQVDRLAELDPALLQDFSAAFHALDGSRAAQKELFRATDALFNGLEEELGLDATTLDDEAAVIKGAVRGFFRRVRQFDRVLERAADGAAQWVGRQLHRLAGETVRSAKGSDSAAMQRMRRVDELLGKVGEDNLDAVGKKHLGRLFRQLLQPWRGTGEGRGDDHGRWQQTVDTSLARATDHMAGLSHRADALRPPIQALDEALARAAPVTTAFVVALATQFEAAIRTLPGAVGPAQMTTSNEDQRRIVDLGRDRVVETR